MTFLNCSFLPCNRRRRTAWEEDVSLHIALFLPQKYSSLPIILKFHKWPFATSDFGTLSGPLLSLSPLTQLCAHVKSCSSAFLSSFSFCLSPDFHLSFPRFPSLVLGPPPAKSISFLLTKYLSGLQLGLQLFEKDVWLSRQFRPKTDIDYRETSSKHTHKKH